MRQGTWAWTALTVGLFSSGIALADSSSFIHAIVPSGEKEKLTNLIFSGSANDRNWSIKKLVVRSKQQGALRFVLLITKVDGSVHRVALAEGDNPEALSIISGRLVDLQMIGTSNDLSKPLDILYTRKEGENNFPWRHVTSPGR